MIRHLSLWILEFFAGLLAALTIFAIAGAWWLSSGPVSLAFLTPYIEEALTPPDSAITVEIEDTVILWAGWDRTVDVRVDNVRLLDSDRRIVAAMPQVSLGFSPQAMLRGLIAPTYIELLRPRLFLVRETDGRLVIGLERDLEGESGETAREDILLPGLIAELLSEPDHTKPLGYLRRVGIVDADLTLEDRKLGRIWRAPRADPVVHWVERGLHRPGNSVPRFHMVWGTGQRLIEALLERIAAHPHKDRLLVLARHRALELIERGGQIVGVAGEVLDEGSEGINVASGEFSAEGDAVVVAAGGVCGNLAKVRERWPEGYGRAPTELLNGSQPSADGAMHEAASRRGASVTHLDRVWFYAAGVRHWQPQHEHHGLSLVPPRSALWVNWQGRRFDSPPLVGGFDTSHLVKTICGQDKQHSWQILNVRIARRELAISGAEFNPAMRDRQLLRFVFTQLMGNKALVDELLANCPDFVAAESVSELVAKMHELDGTEDVDGATLAEEIRRYDKMVRRPQRYHDDDQLRRIAQVRRYRGDRLRTCKFAAIDDPRARPLIAIREQITTRKSLGGIQTDLQSRVLDTSGAPIAGLFAVGEAAGFGGGGVHGKRSLEGTFLGGCVFTARAAAAAIRTG